MSEDAMQPNFAAVMAQSKAAHARGDLERALRHANRLLKLAPNDPQALRWAIRVRFDAKRWQEIIDLASPFVGKIDGLAGPVGWAYGELGDLAEGQRLLALACEEQPDTLAWHYRNASLLSRLGREFESMEALRRAVEVAPDPGGILILAGNELAFGDPDAALQAVEHAQRIRPNAKGAHLIAAKSLMALGRAAEADEQWNAAARAETSKDDVLSQHALELFRHGEFDRGIALLEGVLEQNPGFVPALVQIASAKKITHDDKPLIETMESALERGDITDEERRSIEFALGRAFDGLRDYESAMRHFDEANRLQHTPIAQTGGFDRLAFSQNIDQRIGILNRRVIDDLAAKGNPSESPIFVVGMIRSGTTLAEQILSAHPMVSGAGEQTFWINADQRMMDFGAHRLNEQVLREAADTYLRLLQGFAKGGEARVVDKQPGNLVFAGALHAAFPNARIVYMRRRPIDNAISIWNTHIITSMRFVNDKSNIVFAMREFERLFRYWKDVIPADRMMEVSYEELIEDREPMTRKLLEFCGLPWSEECLHPERNRKLVITPSLWQVRQPVYRSSVDRWKNYEPWLGDFRELLN